MRRHGVRPSPPQAGVQLACAVTGAALKKGRTTLPAEFASKLAPTLLRSRDYGHKKADARDPASAFYVQASPV